MISKKLSIALVVTLVLTAAAFLLSSNGEVASASTSRPSDDAAPSATFPGANLGVIPDGPGTPNLCGTDGTPRNVTFNVTGLSGTVNSVSVDMTFGAPIHTFVGDVTAILIAPNGASQTVFGYTGSTTANGCGDSSDLAGPYTFTDSANAPPSGGWWQSATAAGAAVALTSGSYRSTNRGGVGATNPQPPTNLTAAFTGIPTANGTWTLRLIDGGGGDTGAISAANLTITAGVAPAQHVVDFNGDGKTDHAVVRNTGGGAMGAVTWFYHLTDTATTAAHVWGLASDFFMPEDFDGDMKTDLVVWRSAGTGTFYIFQSTNNTLRTEVFGQTGDDPTVVRDYDGDGKADPAVYRAGLVSGDPSFWYYRGSLNNPMGNITTVPWGQSGDFPAPGDYDGDGKGDFVMQRNNGGGTGIFWMRQTTAGIAAVVFGTPTDVIVPGDYDADGKTDIAVIRGSGGAINWFARKSSNPNEVIYGTWGASATDFPAQGDYDGDGKTDFATWRTSATPGMSGFWVYGSSTGPSFYPWGLNGDYPIANYNSH